MPFAEGTGGRFRMLTLQQGDPRCLLTDSSMATHVRRVIVFLFKNCLVEHEIPTMKLLRFTQNIHG